MDSFFASGLVKYFELLAGIVGIYCYHKSKNRVWIIFALYLIVLFGMEYTGYWLGKMQLYKQNTLLYKYAVIPTLFLMYHYVFYYLLHKAYKLWVLISVLFFISIVLLENLLLQKEHYFSISISLSYGSLAVVIGSIVYLLSIVKSDEILQFNKNMGFWFCVALLVFYVGSFAKLSFFNSLGYSKTSTVAVLYNWIFIILNYIMYILFTIGFIWSKRK